MAPPIIRCTLCYQRGRTRPASHYYQVTQGRCYVCPTCEQQVTNLARTFPQDFTIPSRITPSH
jgi:hypothetical protein